MNSQAIQPMKSLMAGRDFIVIDTEGKSSLSEIAIIDTQGKLIYEAFTQGHPNNTGIRLKCKSLCVIVREFAEIAQGKTLVCHYAEHDSQVLRNSFLKAGVRWPSFSFECSYELARRCFPHLPRYSLGYLSKHFLLRVENKLFDPSRAHTARYDASFTYHLYLKLRERQTMYERLQNTSNPFSSSRVDTPFQAHIDLKAVYHAEYETLKSIIGDIKRDPNQQSKGAIVIGEPGAGKTHLMMRLAKELLKTNRLLFIRQPNNANAVLHHTYARILESFAQCIPDTQHTQLDRLLANSFVKILKSIEEVTTTQKGKQILSVLEQNSLSLYSRIGSEGTQRNRDAWQYIERHITRWWTSRYTAAGHSAAILQGILKFCSYTEPRKKEMVRRWLAASEIPEEEANDIGLENWQDEMGREEFSLEAIAAFGKLSTLDEPLIIIFDQLEGLSDKPTLLANFGSAIKEILTHVPNSLIILNLFPDRWGQFQQFFDGSVVERVSQYEVHLNRPDNEKLRDILSLKAKSVELDLNQLFEPAELDDILSQKSIRAVLNRAAAYYRYKANDIPLPSAATDTSTPASHTNIETRLHRLENEFDALKKTLAGITVLLQPLSTFSTEPITTAFQPQKAPNPIVSPSGTSVPKTELPTDLKAAFPSSPIEESHPVVEPPPVLIVPDFIVADYLHQKQEELERDYDARPHIISDSDDLGKLSEIVEAFQLLQRIDIEQMVLGRKVLPEHLQLTINNDTFVIGFLNVSGNSFTHRIRNFNQLISSYPKTKFHLSRDAREPQIKGNVGKDEIEKFSHAPNGNFAIMDKMDRIHFELAYNLIVDIRERDLDADMATALRVLATKLSSYWLTSILLPHR
jgi:DNA polymerase III epsilon subunit-like protein